MMFIGRPHGVAPTGLVIIRIIYTIRSHSWAVGDARPYRILMYIPFDCRGRRPRRPERLPHQGEGGCQKLFAHRFFKIVVRHKSACFIIEYISANYICAVRHTHHYRPVEQSLSRCVKFLPLCIQKL